MMTVGRLCMKIAGRDAGKKCVIVEDLGKGYFLIDGETRRRKCNVTHLEPLTEVLNIKPKASHDAIVIAFNGLNIELKTTKHKPAGTKPQAIRHQHTKEKHVVEKKPVKKEESKKTEEN